MARPKSKEGRRTPIVVHLESHNDTYIRSLALSSGSSIAKVVNAMVAFLQETDTGFSMPKHVPLKVQRALALVASWEDKTKGVPTKSVLAMPQAVAAATVKRGRKPKTPPRLGNEVIADRS